MPADRLDDFADLSAWTPIASGQAQLRIVPERGRHGPAMRLDYDFQGGGGFVVARKRFDLSLPESFVASFGIRGAGPANILEFKLVDASNQNVWRYREEAFDPPADWLDLRIPSRRIEFAWGPLGGGPPTAIAAIELVVAAGPGGRGSLWFEDLRLEDTTYRLTPAVTASDAWPGCAPEAILDPSPATCWRGGAEPERPLSLTVDFGCEREYGGLVIRWEPERRPRRATIRLGGGDGDWRTCFAANDGVGLETCVYLPEARSRRVALDLEPDPASDGVGIQCLEIQPHDFSRSLNEFLAAVARRARPGHYPRYLLNRQSYWTPVGTGADVTQALFNEEGMVEVDKGSWSVEPFLWVDGRLLTWADVALTQGLEDGALPLPWCEWRAAGLRLRILAGATGPQGASSLHLRYEIHNETDAPRAPTLFAAIRPFQVTPTWQHWRAFGGAARIETLAWENGAARVGEGAGDRGGPGTERGERGGADKWILPRTAPAGFGALAFSQGALGEWLERGELPPARSVADPFGQAAGALRFDLDLPPGATRRIELEIPFGTLTADQAAARYADGSGETDPIARARADWTARLGACAIDLPPDAPGAAGVVETLRTAAAHILIQRDGPALQPGPRRYSRAWIRDGVLMAAALARVGIPAAGAEFIRWYAGFQAADGNLPDCADREGCEWLPEFDAWGEFIFAVMDHYRFTGDREFLAEMWPAVLKCVDYMERLRATRLTDEYATGARRACHGLLPESMSHEGYMAHPVHAYWDDFWALRGFKDAAAMAEVLGEPAEAARLAALRDDFARTLHDSLALAIAERGLEFLPGSVEFADFDATATAIALTVADETHRLPRPAIERTFAIYLEGLRQRIRGTTPWVNYTAYEVRIVGALVRLGWRREALELLTFLLGDRRIRPWNQWPEISWRDPLGPSFIGDMPHSWIGAEYILAVRSLFAYEREADDCLVIAAGLPEDWLDGDGVAVRDLPTWHGRLSYRLWRAGPDDWRLSLGGDLRLPSGGLLIMPPLAGPLTAVEIDGREHRDFSPDWVRCRSCPAELRLTSLTSRSSDAQIP